MGRSSAVIARAVRRPGAGRRQVQAPELPDISGDENVSLARRAYDAISEGLMAGAISPGSPLTSRSLSAALGVSVTPVREALKQLEADGALTSRSKSAFFVNDPSRIEYEQITELRLSTEGLAIRKAAAVATPADIAVIRRAKQEYEDVQRAPDRAIALALPPNFRFHFAIYRLSGSPILLKVIETTWLRIGPALHRYMRNVDEIEPGLRIHDEMVRALERNDPDAAEEALRRDLLDAAELIYPELRERSGEDGAGASWAGHF